MDTLYWIYIIFSILIVTYLGVCTWEYIEHFAKKTKPGKTSALGRFMFILDNVQTRLQKNLDIDHNNFIPHQQKFMKKGALRLILTWSVLAPLTIGGHLLMNSLYDNRDIRKIPELIHNLEVENRNDAIDSLASIGSDSIKPLISAFHGTENGYLKSGIVEALRQISDRDAVMQLISILQDEDTALRAGAAEALGRTLDRSAVDPLLVALNDQAPTIRAAAAQSLGVLGDERAIGPLIILLNDGDWTVRVKVAKALIEIGDEHAVEPLMVALENRDLPVVAEISAFYIERGLAGTEPILIDALNLYGTKEIANIYLNCGNLELEMAARLWAKSHGYEIGESMFGYSAHWGGQ